jgi:mono/diheme cytochrome c family protein
MLPSMHIKRMAGMLVLAMLAAALLAACGGATPAQPAAVVQPAPVVQPTAVAEPTAAPIVQPTAVAEPTAAPVAEQAAPAAASDPLESLDDELVAQGKVLFEQTLACASCHGMDGTGNETIGAPNIQGKTDAQIRTALAGVEMMSSLKVKPAELKAVGAYLRSLSGQP